MTPPRLVLGRVTEGVWCPTCNAPVRIRIPVHNRGRHYPPLADIEVCASCGHHYMPISAAVATITRRSWQFRIRPWDALLWWIHETSLWRHGRQPVECGYGDCHRPGWWDCAWIEQVDFGNLRHGFCSGKHRRQWLAEHFNIPT
jgi:hypothetical protein